MANIQSVSFTSPYAAEESEIERKRKLAEALQTQAGQPLEQQTAGGWVIPISPLQGLAKMAQGAAAGYNREKANQQEKDLSKRYQDDLTKALTGAQEAATGTPAIQAPADDLGGGPGRPAVAPNRMAMIQALMGHPATQPMAMQQLGQKMSQDQLAATLASAGYGGQPTQGQPPQPGAAPGVPAAPAATPGRGIPPGVDPLAWALMVQKGDTAGLAKLVQEAADKQNAPVINRGYGVGTMRNGQYVPDQASIDQALSMERGKQGIQGPQEPPITLQTTSGQTVQLSRPEWAAFQKDGQLPARITGQAPQVPPEQVQRTTAPTVEAAKAQFAVGGGQPRTVTVEQPKPAGLGTPGVSQPQEDQIRQAGQQAANTEAGREFISEMRQNYSKLRDVPATLANIDRAKALAAGEAKTFMGPFGESKLAITKFMRANVPGMGNLKTDSVTSAEELQSTLFNQVMDNLKKMDASPSQYQQQVMQEAFGTLRTDPQSVPKIMDVFSDILRNRVDLHNQTVNSAEGRGTTFPYDVNVKLPERNLVKDIVGSGGGNADPLGIRKK